MKKYKGAGIHSINELEKIVQDRDIIIKELKGQIDEIVERKGLAGEINEIIKEYLTKNLRITIDSGRSYDGSYIES